MKALLGIGLVALIAFGVFALDLPSRIADLGSGNLTQLVAPTTTVAFGKTVELDGRAARPPLAVTATKVVRVRSTTKGVRAAKRHVLVGVQLAIKNIGDAPFDVGMGIEARAADGRGATYPPDGAVLRIRGGRVLNVTRVRPGAQVRGVVVFEVPRGTSLTTVRFTVGSGLTRTAEWTTKD
jgi:hypothetical protein